MYYRVSKTLSCLKWIYCGLGGWTTGKYFSFVALHQLRGISVRHKIRTPTFLSLITPPLCQVIKISGPWCDRLFHLCLCVHFFKLMESRRWSFGKFNVGFCRPYLSFIFLARQSPRGLSFKILLSSAFTHTTTEQPEDFHKIWHFQYFRSVIFVVSIFLQLAQLLTTTAQEDLSVFVRVRILGRWLRRSLASLFCDCAVSVTLWSHEQLWKTKFDGESFKLHMTEI